MAGYLQVSRKEAGLRFLLMQMANAATRQSAAADPDRGLEQLSTALTSLHAILTALRTTTSGQGAADAADVLRLSPEALDAYGLLALPVPAPIKFLEALHYEKTPEGHLLLSHPERDEVQSAVEGGLQALEWFERQNNKGGGEGDGDTESGRRTGEILQPSCCGAQPSCCHSHGGSSSPI